MGNLSTPVSSIGLQPFYVLIVLLLAMYLSTPFILNVLKNVLHSFSNDKLGGTVISRVPHDKTIAESMQGRT